jgi:hypothetical protein
MDVKTWDMDVWTSFNWLKTGSTGEALVITKVTFRII